MLVSPKGGYADGAAVLAEKLQEIVADSVQRTQEAGARYDRA